MRTILPALFAFALMSATTATATDLSSGARKHGGLALWPDQQCNDRGITRKIAKRFNWAQRTTFDRDLQIAELSNPREYAFRPAEPQFHDRRFCQADALMSDGRHYPVYYMISYDRHPPLGGGLEFCVSGLDYFRAYAPGCSQLRPH